MSGDINSKDENGNTALHRALREEDEAAANALLAQGADINAIDINGYTALIWALAQGYEDIAKDILSRDDISAKMLNAVTTYGDTALIFASSLGNKEILKILLTKGADINARNNDNETALHFAAINGHIDTVKMLLAYSAIDPKTLKPKLLNLNAKDNNGKTAADIATDPEIKELILEATPEKLPPSGKVRDVEMDAGDREYKYSKKHPEPLSKKKGILSKFINLKNKFIKSKSTEELNAEDSQPIAGGERSRPNSEVSTGSSTSMNSDNGKNKDRPSR